jgi:two-component system chemotaxis response regulator CheB
MGRDLVVVGASAGGVESLRDLVAGLDAELPATVLVVLHFPPSSASALPAILQRRSPLPVSAATDRQPLEPGRVLVAPPGHHLVVLDDHVELSRGPRENGYRPAVDVLFRSAARARGPRVVGIVLSGALDDGTAGMQSIRQVGGLVFVQDPAEAAYPSMPASVIRHVGADRVGTVAELAAAVNALPRVPFSQPVPPDPPRILSDEVEMASMRSGAFADPDRPGRPSGFSCPDCNGSLFEIDEGGLLRFRCRVGHAWSSLALLGAQTEALDDALWMAFRSLEEKAALSHQLAERAGERGNTLSRQRYLEKAEEASRSAALIHQLLEQPLSTLLVDDAAEEDHAERG